MSIKTDAKRQILKDLKNRLQEIQSTCNWRWKCLKEDEQTMIALKEMIAELESN